MTEFNQIPSQWLCGSAPEIEDRTGSPQQCPKPVEPGLFKQAAAGAALDPVLRLALVQVDNCRGFFRRHLRTHRPPIPRLECFPFQEVRSDIGLFLDGVIVAKDAVGDERAAWDDRVLVELHPTK